MAKKIGLFNSQQQAIEVINQLEQAGFTPGEMKILAKDSEHSRRIESETDVHADEMRELAEAHERDGESGALGMAISSNYGGAYVAGGYGVASYGVSPGVGGLYAFGSPFPFLESRQISAYRALGLDKDEADLCYDSVENGAVAIIVETDESKSLMDKDDGADLSRLSVAEGIFRKFGASRITNSS